MATTMIPDGELLGSADVVTVWVATPEAPTDMWSLRDAIAWMLRQPNAARLSIFRAPGSDVRAAWVGYEQARRLAAALGMEPWELSARAQAGYPRHD